MRILRALLAVTGLVLLGPGCTQEQPGYQPRRPPQLWLTPLIHDHEKRADLPKLRTSIDRDDANRCLHVLL